MTTLPRRPHTALLVVDLQVGVVGEAYDRDRVVVNVATVVESARAAGVAVVWVQNANEEAPRSSEPWQIVDELTPRDDEPLVHKGYPDAFEETDLEALLAGRGVGRLVVAGAQTDECIRATLHGAVVRGYDATLVSDAHTTMDLTAYGAPPPAQVIAHTNLYWHNHEAPGRTCDTVAATAVRW